MGTRSDAITTAVRLFLSLKRVGWLADILFSFARILWKAIRAKFIVPFVSRKKQRYRSPWNIYGRLITLRSVCGAEARSTTAFFFRKLERQVVCRA